MKIPEQLKGTIRSMAEKKSLRVQEILQMFFFELVLERLANSAHRKKFILKGGLLISSMIGIGERTTMDMDTTVRGIPMEEDEIVKTIKEESQMYLLWDNYVAENKYIDELKFNSVLDTLEEVAKLLDF